ncbi:hypothetical protein ACQP2P_14935 [Dactylosporangium sp. CA-139114]|uniref:hypothetical protein n=1 Tax=Dactylosporangium sp. CA-139114 TaxID=3239931 RepID=UPI003D9891A3
MTALLLLLGTPALVACGGNGASDKDQQSAAEADRDKQLKFSKCMRDNGYDMPDPDGNADGTGAVGTVTANDAAFQAALEKCRPLLPNGGEPPKLSEEERAEALKFAKCMRDKGIADYPDPSADGRPGRPPLPDPSDPAYNAKIAELQQATEKCGGPAGAVPAGPAQ